MPLLDRLERQKRGRQIGEIRLGNTTINSKGKRVPTGIEVFRFTTKQEHVALRVGEAYGGRVEHVKLLNETRTFEVVSDVEEIDVMVPAGDAVISQFYEMWSGNQCHRRCDSKTNFVSNGPCKCPADLEARKAMAKGGGACKPITRVYLVLPDVPDLGVWLVRSTGDFAADELAGTAAFLQKARDHDIPIPAKLINDGRRTHPLDEARHDFRVPVLSIPYTLRQITQLAAGTLAEALPPPPATAHVLTNPVQALQAGDPDDEPVEAEFVDEHEAKPHSGAAVEQVSVADRLDALDPSIRGLIEQRMTEARLPQPLTAAGEKQVNRWIDEAEKQGAPF